MIPGFSATPMLAGGSNGFAGIKFISWTFSANNNLAIPTEAKSGDLAVLFIAGYGNNSLEPALAGWEAIGTKISVSNYRHWAVRKVLESGDLGTSLTILNASSTRYDNLMLLFRASEAPWGGVSSNNQQANLGLLTDQTITAGTSPYVAIACYRTDFNPLAATRGFSPREDAEVSGTTTQSAKYKIFNEGTSPAAITASYGQAFEYNFLRSFRIGLL